MDLKKISGFELFFVDLKKIWQVLIILWIWKRFVDYWPFCRFGQDYSIWNDFRFENDLFIQKMVVDMKNIFRFEKELSIWKTFVDLGNIICQWPFLATVS